MPRGPQMSFEAESAELCLRFRKVIKKLGIKNTHIFNKAMKELIDEQSTYPGGIRSGDRGDRRADTKAGGGTNKRSKVSNAPKPSKRTIISFQD